MKSRAKVITQKHIREIPAYGNKTGWFMSEEKQDREDMVKTHRMLNPNRRERRTLMRSKIVRTQNN